MNRIAKIAKISAVLALVSTSYTFSSMQAHADSATPGPIQIGTAECVTAAGAPCDAPVQSVETATVAVETAPVAAETPAPIQVGTAECVNSDASGCGGDTTVPAAPVKPATAPVTPKAVAPQTRTQEAPVQEVTKQAASLNLDQTPAAPASPSVGAEVVEASQAPAAQTEAPAQSPVVETPAVQTQELNATPVAFSQPAENNSSELLPAVLATAGGGALIMGIGIAMNRRRQAGK